MNLEKLMEQKTEVIAKLEALKTLAETETRAFNDEELEKVNEYKAEVERITKTIKAFEETRSYSEPTPVKTKAEVRSLADDLKDLQVDANIEIEVGQRELRDASHTLSSNAVGTGNAPTENIAKMTFADYVLDKLAYVSPLYSAIRKERFGNSKHQIPVQANKLGKFVPMKELAEYSKQVADFEPIKLEAHKFGTLITFSNEAVEDTGYNVEAELLRQLSDSYGITLDELVVNGESTMGVEGLKSFGTDDNAKVATIPSTITTDAITDMYFALPIRYRQNATWVINDAMAAQLTKVKDDQGRPLLIQSYNGAPFGAGCTLLGRPVIINEYVDSIYFGDLSRALIVGERKSITLQKSTEYGFIRDEVAIKANVRMDIKKGLTEAMVVGKVAVAKASSK